MPISTAPVSAITHQMILLIAFPPEILTAFPLARRVTIDGAAYQGVDLIDSVKFRVDVIPAGAGTLGAPVAWLNLRVADPGVAYLFYCACHSCFAGIQGRRWQTGSWSLSLARPSESNQREGRPWFTATDRCPCAARREKRLWISLE
jgi:hypothetical protein